MKKLEKLVEQLIGNNPENALRFFKSFKMDGQIEIFRYDVVSFLEAHRDPPKTKKEKKARAAEPRNTLNDHDFILSFHGIIYGISQSSGQYKPLLKEIKVPKDLEHTLKIIFNPFMVTKVDRGEYSKQPSQIYVRMMASEIAPELFDTYEKLLAEKLAHDHTSVLWSLSGTLFLRSEYYYKFENALRQEASHYSVPIAGKMFPFPQIRRCLTDR